MKKPVRYHGFVHKLDSKTKEDKKRIKEYLKELKEDGFDGTELWDLGPTTLTSFIYPRLKAFVERSSTNHAKNIWFTPRLKKALKAFELIHKGEIEDDFKAWRSYQFPGDKHYDTVQDGLKAFAEIYLGLWT